MVDCVELSCPGEAGEDWVFWREGHKSEKVGGSKKRTSDRIIQ